MDRVFFLPFMAPLWRAMKKRKEKRESLTCRTDRANEANKMFISCSVIVRVSVYYYMALLTIAAKERNNLTY